MEGSDVCAYVGVGVGVGVGFDVDVGVGVGVGVGVDVGVDFGKTFLWELMKKTTDVWFP